MKTRKELKSQAKEIIAAHRSEVYSFAAASSAVTTILMEVILVGIALMFGGSVNEMGEMTSAGASFGVLIVYGLLVAVVTAPTQYAMCQYVLQLIGGQPFDWSVLWSGWKGKNYARSLVTFLIHTGTMFASGFVGVMVVMIPLAIVWAVMQFSMAFSGDSLPSAVTVLFVLLILIALVAGLIIFPFFFDALFGQAMMIVASDEEISGWQAIKMSAKMMKGHKWEYVKLNYSFFGWMLLAGLAAGAIAVLVGASGLPTVVTQPLDTFLGAVVMAVICTQYMMVTRALYYRELVGEVAEKEIINNE